MATRLVYNFSGWLFLDISMFHHYERSMVTKGYNLPKAIFYKSTDKVSEETAHILANNPLYKDSSMFSEMKMYSWVSCFFWEWHIIDM